MAGDTAVFSNATGRTITIDAPRACDSLNVSDVGTWTWSGTAANTLTIGTLFNHAGTGDSTVNSYLAGSGGLTCSGHLHVAGSNTYAGVTTLTGGGYLFVGNNFAFQGSFSLSLGAGTIASYGGSYILGTPVSLDGDTIFGHGHDASTRSLTFTNAATLTGSRVIKVYGFDVTRLQCGHAHRGGSVEDLDFRGTYNWEYDGTNSDLIACTTLAFGGSATLNCSYLGAGDAPTGNYPLFTYTGSNPTLPSWSVTPPAGRAARVSLDSANKTVVLTVAQLPKGTLILLR